MTRRIGGLVSAVVVVGAGWLGFGAGPAGAVGDAALSKVIIANPVPGWQPEPIAGLNRVVSYIGGLEADAIVPKGGNSLTAVKGWRDPTDHAHYVIVALVALRFDGQSASSVAAQTAQAAVGALASLCSGATQPSVKTGTITQVPGSHALACTISRGGAQPYAVSWARGNAFALVISVQGALSVGEMTVVATSQYAAMPAGGVAVAASASAGSSGVLLELLVGLVVVALAALVLWRVLRRRSRPRQPLAPRKAKRAAGSKPGPLTQAPLVRRGVVQRPASRAGGVGPSAQPEATPPPPQP